MVPPPWPCLRKKNHGYTAHCYGGTLPEDNYVEQPGFCPTNDIISGHEVNHRHPAALAFPETCHPDWFND